MRVQYKNLEIVPLSSNCLTLLSLMEIQKTMYLLLIIIQQNKKNNNMSEKINNGSELTITSQNTPIANSQNSLYNNAESEGGINEQVQQQRMLGSDR